MEGDIMEATSPEGISYYKNYYERYGYKVILCEICHKITNIEYPKVCVSGPSDSSGMFCQCEK